MKNNIKELIMIIGLIGVLAFILNPMGLYYSNMALGASIILLVAFFTFISIFIWKEVPRDEREEKNQNSAGRIAFLFGSIVMILGIVFQSVNHNIDVWLVYGLAVMVISRFVFLKYKDFNN